MKRIFTFLFCAISINAFSQSTTVVISQVYGGGGATSGTPTYSNDYVELHNVSNVSQDISGWSIQYGSSTGNFGSSASNIYTFGPGSIIQAGKYLLIQFGSNGTVGAAISPTPDSTTTSLNLAAGSGKVALVNNSTPLACGANTSTCTLPNSAIVDLVSYGAANNGEGGTTVNDGTALTNTQGAVRKNSGCTDTNNNNADFNVVSNPVPRNSSSAAVNCSAVLPLTINSLNASFNGKSSEIKWTSQNEINVKGFSIEKSENGNTYSEIAFVNAKNLITENTYSFEDVNVKPGANFYRIKTINKDGSSKYSTVVVVNNRVGITAQVFPNPVISNLTVNHTPAVRGAIIRVLSIEGRQVKTFAVQAGAVQTALSVSELVKGNYLLIFENDGVKTTTKFSKQ